jgi:hypothetical protein
VQSSHYSYLFLDPEIHRIASLIHACVGSLSSFQLHPPSTTERAPDTSLFSVDRPSRRLSTSASIFQHDRAYWLPPFERTNPFNVPQEDVLLPTTEQPDDGTHSHQFEVTGVALGIPDTEIMEIEDYLDRLRRSPAPSPEPSSSMGFRNFQLKLRIFRILTRKALGL